MNHPRWWDLHREGRALALDKKKALTTAGPLRERAEGGDDQGLFQERAS